MPVELFGRVEFSVPEFENAAAEVTSKAKIDNAFCAGGLASFLP
jgi:hypothetical protein